MSHIPVVNQNLDVDIETFFETIVRAKVLGRQIGLSLPQGHAFQALNSQVIAYLPDHMDEVPESILEIHTGILHDDSSHDRHSEGEGQNDINNGEDPEEVRSPHDAAGSSPLPKPTSAPEDPNPGEVLSDASTTYSDTRLVPPTPPANSNCSPSSDLPPSGSNPPLKPNPSRENPPAPSASSTRPPADMSHLSAIAQGKKRVTFGRANAFLGANNQTIFFDVQTHGSNDEFSFNQANKPKEPTPSLQELVEKERARARLVVEKGHQPHQALLASRAKPSTSAAIASPPRRALEKSYTSQELPDILASRTGYNAPTSAATSPPQPNPAPGPALKAVVDKKGKKRAREEDEAEQEPEAGSVPAGASTFDPALASTSDDVADKRPTRKAKTSKASSSKGSSSKESKSKASTSRATSGVSKFFRGEDVSPSNSNSSSSSRTRGKRFVAEEEGPRATYEGRPVVMIMSKYRSKSVEIPEEDLLSLPAVDEEPIEAPAPVPAPAKNTKATKGKGRGKKRARVQEPEEDPEHKAPVTESALVQPQLAGPSPPKKPRRGRAQAVSQPEAGPSRSSAGAGPSNTTAGAGHSSQYNPPTVQTASAETVPAPQATTAEPDAAASLGQSVIPARPLRRSTRQAKFKSAANGKANHS